MRHWPHLTTCALLLALASCKTADPKPAPVAPPPRAQAPTLVAAQPVSPPPVQEESKPKPDPVVELIAQVEKAFHAGQAEYKAGHLEAAKDSFNRAFDLLLESGLDLRSDRRLQQEFDKVVEGVNHLEMIALQQGDGFTEQKSEPAPIDEANAVTFPVDAAIKAKAEAEMLQTRSDLPLVLNDAVAGYINYFSTRGKPTLERSLTRGGRYRAMILRTLREEGVPQDLYYLAVAESGFHPLALSRAGARGMWQFMASRASGYGLTRNWWVDERQDPEKSTRAAARHLKDLYQQFGDWYLAMAAYNSGPGNVQQAVQRTGYADFWELYKRSVLPQETRNYVPIILAVTIMAKNPEQYGLDQVIPDPPEQVDQVEINYPVDLRLVAECIDASLDRLQELNPSLLRMTTPKEGSFELKLPAGTAEKFQAAIAAIPPGMRVWWRYHKVAPGETLGAIARQYRTSVKAITEVNSLEGDDLLADSKLIIPIAKGKHSPLEAASFTYAKRPTYYKVRKGDTVLSVADDFGVPAAKLRRWNRLKGNRLRAGRRLRIYRPVAAARSEKSSKSRTSSKLRASAEERPRTHTVQPGDTLFGIASTYHTTVSALRESNSLSGSLLHVGDVLVIPTP
jgi:membrane-bound lytic murein transglycosylase D